MIDPPPTNSPFPASDPGFAALPVDELMAQNADIIARIKLCYGSDRDSFEREVLSLIRRYAAYVHLLPATADNYFSTPGGLLRLGLETAFFSLQGTDAHIFSGRSTISARRQLEPRWRHATFIAGLCSELHRVLSHLIVVDGRGEQWPAFLQPLTEWLAARHADRYFVRWRPQAMEARGLGVFALPHVVPTDVLQHLSEDNAVIVPQLLASVGGVPLYRDRNVLDELVRRSTALVIDRNLVANADRYGLPQFGSHLERYLVDALRRLASGSSAWVPNREKSRVWFGQDGLFLLWPGAAEDVHKLLEADLLPGIPKASETMLELLIAAGVFATQDATQPTWTIHPPGSKAALEAVKLATPAILFSGIEPAPPALGQRLVRRPGEAEPPSPTPVPDTAGGPGTQLSLIPAMPVSPTPAGVDSATRTAPAPSFALQAPLRLNPLVRDALSAAVHTLNPDAGPAQCCTVASGVFVPLSEFERRGVQPSIALRSLAELRMLARVDAEAPPTLTRDFNGTPTVGLVIDPRFIEGLDLEGFSLPAPEPA
jgi:conjugal transfer pilus assembly protein TraI